VDSLKEYFFQGFEWENDVKFVKVNSINEVCYKKEDINIAKMIAEQKNANPASKIKHAIKKLLPFKI